MITDLAADLAAFRASVHDWLVDNIPAGWEAAMADASAGEVATFQRRWLLDLAKVGLAAAHWPKDYGGAGLGLEHQVIIADEMANTNAPSLELFTVSLNHVPATLIPFGTPQQKQRYLPGILAGDLWCQGFSEPDAGSDLASLRCRAARIDDYYLVNGQKIWSSMAMEARYCILLARTSVEGAKQAGISYFILDMEADGVEVRPIHQANGADEFGEIFLTDVHIPAVDLIGGENQGWKVAQATLAAERGVLAFEGAERQRYRVEQFYRHAVRNDAGWLRDDQLRREFMAVLAEVQAGRRLIRRLLRESHAGDPAVAMTSVYVKLTGTTLRQKIASLLVRIAALDSQFRGGGATVDERDWMRDYITSFGDTIAGGTNEIMRNLIAERGFGMPKG